MNLFPIFSFPGTPNESERSGCADWILVFDTTFVDGGEKVSCCHPGHAGVSVSKPCIDPSRNDEMMWIVFRDPCEAGSGAWLLMKSSVSSSREGTCLVLIVCILDFAAS